ncbi:DUF2634 domain-containing protein, partial [Hungatella hathewayi]|uniref:DUF2634 domain-containing protein n=1 Tax=Hungatella hathewayi TaxID=154046 RepID=UPI0022E09F72
MELTTSMVLREQTFEGKTYKVLPCKIEGYVNDLEALKQAIYKVLATEQFEYPVYSFNYGIAWKELIGEEQPYVRAEMKRMIQEALLHDDRIREVDGFSFSFTGDTLWRYRNRNGGACMTYEELLHAMLDRVPSNVDKREGSIIYDALAP